MTLEQFERCFGRPGPAFRTSVPGRVNLIGEHIDYAGLPVLPIAIQRRVTLLVRPRSDRLVAVANADARFEPVTFAVDDTIPPYPKGHWGNYVKAAVAHLDRRYGGLGGFDAVVVSDLPAAMGLSSSSALVVGVGVSVLTAAGRTIEPLELAHELAEAERYVGTRGGGMDQAICLLARAGHASRIAFNPLGASPIAVPERWRFIVASSLVSAEKSGSAQDEYNRRRHDVETAVQFVGEALGSSGASLPDLIGRHTPDELIEASHRGLPEIPHVRFRHVVGEAARVHEAERALEEDDPVAFGRLMSQSHASLREDFAVSSPELDTLVETAERAGALGARLTGAGFGGCVVALARTDTAAAVCAALDEAFYRRRGVTDAADVRFVAEPSGGARVEPLA